MTGLPTIREARLRHVKYYVQLAHKNRDDVDKIALDLGNITQAANFCVEIAEWDSLRELTDAVNDYWLRTEWSNYIKFNGSLVINDLNQYTDERLERISQLVELEEMRGNYVEALHWGKMLVQSHSQNQNRNVDAAIKALKKTAQLTRTQSSDEESVEYVTKGLAIARQVGIPKDEVDFLFELALVHKKRQDFCRAQEVCEESLQIARSIGYSIKEIDILALLASLAVLQNQFEPALELYGQVLANFRERGDTVREDSTLAEMSRARELARLEQEKKRKIFISYNHEDRGFVEHLANDLKVREMPVWWDQWEIKVGDSIIQKVSDGIAGSAFLIPVLSAHSVKSQWVKREIGSALMEQLKIEKNIIILPVLVSDCEVPVLLREIKWADFRTDYERGLKSLLEALAARAC